MKLKDFLFNLICEGYTVEQVVSTRFRARKLDRKYEIAPLDAPTPNRWGIGRVDKFSYGARYLSDPIPIEQFDARNFDY